MVREDWAQKNGLNIRTAPGNWAQTATGERVQLNKTVAGWVRIGEQVSKVIAWVADIKRDMLVEMDWIQKTGATVTKEGIGFNVLENEIPEWLEDLKEVFEEIPEGELPPHRDGVDHEITIKTEKIKPSPLIPTLTKSNIEQEKTILEQMP